MFCVYMILVHCDTGTNIELGLGWPSYSFYCLFHVGSFSAQLFIIGKILFGGIFPWPPRSNLVFISTLLIYIMNCNGMKYEQH